MNAPAISLIALGIGLIALAVDAEISVRKGRPSLAGRLIATLGLGTEPDRKTEMSRIAHRFETGFELLTGIAALACGVALL